MEIYIILLIFLYIKCLLYTITVKLSLSPRSRSLCFYKILWQGFVIPFRPCVFCFLFSYLSAALAARVSILSHIVVVFVYTVLIFIFYNCAIAFCILYFAFDLVTVCCCCFLLLQYSVALNAFLEINDLSMCGQQPLIEIEL